MHHTLLTARLLAMAAMLVALLAGWVNPGSVVLSGEMMLRHLGWNEAANLVIQGLNGAITSKRVTYDFARLMQGASEIKCSEFGDNIIQHMGWGELEQLHQLHQS